MEVTFLPPAAPDIRVKGNGFDIASGDISPRTSDNTDFGTISTGVAIERRYLIRNLGDADLQVTGIPRVVVSGSPFFKVSLQPAASVSPTGSTNFTVKFTPEEVGLAEATVYIVSTDPDTNPYHFTIQGTGAIIPEMELLGNGRAITDGDSKPSLADNTDFGMAKVRSGAIDHSFVIKNIGTAPLYLYGSPRVSVTGESASDFSVVAPPANPVAKGGGTTSFIIRFTPSRSGLRSGVITIENNDSNEAPYSFSVQGTGDNFSWTLFLPAILNNR